MEIVAVLIVQAVKHRHILQQLCLICFQGSRNILDIGRNLAVAGLHPFNFVFTLGEKARQAFFLLRIPFKAFQLGNEVDQHIADFARILCFYGIQSGLGKIGNPLLGIRSEQQHVIGIGHIHLLDKIIDSLFFGFCQLAFIKARKRFRLRGRCLLNAFRGFGSDIRFGRGGGGVELENRSFRHVGFLLNQLFFSYRAEEEELYFPSSVGKSITGAEETLIWASAAVRAFIVSPFSPVISFSV